MVSKDPRPKKRYEGYEGQSRINHASLRSCSRASSSPLRVYLRSQRPAAAPGGRSPQAARTRTHSPAVKVELVLTYKVGHGRNTVGIDTGTHHHAARRARGHAVVQAAQSHGAQRVQVDPRLLLRDTGEAQLRKTTRAGGKLFVVPAGALASAGFEWAKRACIGLNRHIISGSCRPSSASTGRNRQRNCFPIRDGNHPVWVRLDTLQERRDAIGASRQLSNSQKLPISPDGSPSSRSTRAGASTIPQQRLRVPRESRGSPSSTCPPGRQQCPDQGGHRESQGSHKGVSLCAHQRLARGGGGQRLAVLHMPAR
jgi:hypothetical protein